jgi:hypothetical protein
MKSLVSYQPSRHCRGSKTLPTVNHPTAAISEWLTLAISLDAGPRSLAVDPATLHPTFEAVQTHLVDVARLLFAAVSEDPDDFLAEPKPEDWIVISASDKRHGFYWDCEHPYVRTRFILVRPRRAGRY